MSERGRIEWDKTSSEYLLTREESEVEGRVNGNVIYRIRRSETGYRPWKMRTLYDNDHSPNRLERKWQMLPKHEECANFYEAKRLCDDDLEDWGDEHMTWWQLRKANIEFGRPNPCNPENIMSVEEGMKPFFEQFSKLQDLFRDDLMNNISRNLYEMAYEDWVFNQFGEGGNERD